MKGTETHTLRSLRSWRFSGECCSFLATEPREDWEQVKEGYSLAATLHVTAPPPRKHHGHKNSASYAGYIIILTTP